MKKVITIYIKHKEDKKKLDDANKRIKKTKKNLDRAKLGAMFFGMAMVRAFKGVTASSMDMMGVWDIMNSMLGMMFLPIAHVILNTLLWLWDVFDSLPEPLKDFLNVIGGSLLVFGFLASMITLISLGLKNLGALGIWGFLETVITALATALGISFGLATILVGAIIIAIMVIIRFRKEIWAFVKKAWKWFTVDLPLAISRFVFKFVTWITELIPKIKEKFGEIKENILEIMRSALEGLKFLFLQLPLKLANALASRMSIVKDALWDLLPTWLQNAISGVGKVASSIRKAFGGIFGMAEGGVVTRPTTALIGEKGPEAVIPLDRIGSIGGINITVNTQQIGGNIDILAKKLADKFSFELSRVRY